MDLMHPHYPHQQLQSLKYRTASFRKLRPLPLLPDFGVLLETATPSVEPRPRSQLSDLWGHATKVFLPLYLMLKNIERGVDLALARDPGHTLGLLLVQSEY